MNNCQLIVNNKNVYSGVEYQYRDISVYQRVLTPLDDSEMF